MTDDIEDAPDDDEPATPPEDDPPIEPVPDEGTPEDNVPAALFAAEPLDPESEPASGTEADA